jgi:hypothetical protein
MLRLRDEYRCAILIPTLSMTMENGAEQPRFARRTAEGGCPYIDLFQSFHQIQIREHSVVTEDAGFGVGGHVDGADVFYTGGVGGH